MKTALGHRQLEIGLGVVLVILLCGHGWVKFQQGIFPEMLWTCHLATAMVAIGLLIDRVSWTRIGGWFSVGIGFPAWCLDLLAGATTTWTGVSLHLVVQAVGLVTVFRFGVNLPMFLGSIALWILGTGLARLLTPPALNVNLAFYPWIDWPVGIPFWIYHLMNFGAAVSWLTLTQWIVSWLLPRSIP